jgi:membrane-bound lytic murein transglycosylase B
MFHIKKFLYPIVFSVLIISTPVFAAGSFDSWLSDFRTEAHRRGVSKPTITRALSGIQPLPKVLELDRKQPEGTMTFAKYKKNVISQTRIDKGRRLYREHAFILKEIEKKYGVPASVIVALWGIETSYGENTGGFDVVEALATLAYDGRRSEFFKDELINALKILDEGHIELASMKGSWAGAMGQNQFMPSSFKKFAVDHNGDGKRDIWKSLPDVFASTANYLKKSGWLADRRWGREVSIPDNLPESITGLEHSKTLAEWKSLGVRLPDGEPLTVVRGMKAALVRPDGVAGPAFLVYDNYRVIMAWNKSVYFATSVGLLSDAIAEGS